MMAGKRVYVAGPYVQGDVVVNVKRAIEAGERLLDAGYWPFVPHLSHFWHLLYPHVRETWLDYGLSWLKVCDAVVRLPGASDGADLEVMEAVRLRIPVYDGLEEFLNRAS